MFSFSKDNDMITLYFKNELIEITCDPENPDCLLDENNGFDSSPSNGEFNFYYDDNYISFFVGKYGDGNGGALMIKFKMNDAIKESLKNALREWREYLEKKRLEDEDEDEE